MNTLFPAIIVDDMITHRDVLKKKLERYCPQVTIKASCSSIGEALEAVAEHHPALLFLDIELGSQNGFDLLKKLDGINLKVIFVSAYNSQENLLRAIKASAAGFVTKPIDGDELVFAVEKALENYDTGHSGQQVVTLVHNLSTPNLQSQMILLSNKADGEKQVRIGDIIFCESENTKIYFRFAGQIFFTVTGSLSAYEELLKPYGFYRVQRSYLININCVDRVRRGEKDIIMQHYPNVEMSASRDKELWNNFLSAWESKAIRPS